MPLEEPAFFTSIILPTFNEFKYLPRSLSSLKAQNLLLQYPDKFEIIVVDSESTDGTFSLVQEYADSLLTAEGRPGKLTARDIGIRSAKGKVIVAVDADSYYPPNWLNLLIRHFKHSEVVGVSAPRITEGAAISLLSRDVVGPLFFRSMCGGNSAFSKDAYFQTGGFNLDVNQHNIFEMILEEEVRFQRKLRQHGQVVYDLQAIMFTSGRRGNLLTDPDFNREVGKIRF